MVNKYIDVRYDVYSSNYSIRQNLKRILSSYDILSFDTEVRSIYNKAERKEAEEYLKDCPVNDPYYKKAMVVSKASGLSYPSITSVTHFIFGTSKDHSYIFICTNPKLEQFIWECIGEYEGKLLVHNALFDLKIMYNLTSKLPVNYVDTSLFTKCLINHVNIWKAEIGLKELMGSHYDPKWQIMNDYEPEDLKNEDFLNYAAIDGAAVYFLYTLINKEISNG